MLLPMAEECLQLFRVVLRCSTESARLSFRARAGGWRLRCLPDGEGRPRPSPKEELIIGALIVTYTILGVPYNN